MEKEAQIIKPVNHVLECILQRRSYRKYKEQQITEVELKTILEAGLYAPNAGSGQRSAFIVTQDRELNEILGRINRSMSPADKRSTVSKEQPSILDDPTIKSAFYGAPTVVTIIALTNFLYSEADCAVAAQNMMLAAQSIGVASCMVARANETFSSEIGQQLLKDWKISEGYKAFYHVLLGYADGDTPKVKDRKEGRIIKISY